MGGDRAPQATIEGAVRWHRSTGFRATLVGDISVMQQELNKTGVPRDDWTLIDAPTVIGMADNPVQTIRSEPQASIRRCAELVKSGEAEALVSMGNTGATLAAGVLIVGRAAGVGRPGLAAMIPTHAKPTLVIDVGANAEARPDQLRDFGLMGTLYKQQLGQTEPRVAILSNGEESSKGSLLTLAAAELLTDTPLNFIGNIEPGGIFAGEADVVVCDGFTGNLFVKSIEATAEFAFSSLRSAVKDRPFTLPGLALLYPALRAVRKRTDYDQYGGVPLLGVNGVVIIGHGRSNALAVENALAAAANAIDHDLVRKITVDIAAIPR
jgi:glycerol-3-phosphate acyltransferase PlsX